MMTLENSQVENMKINTQLEHISTSSSCEIHAFFYKQHLYKQH